ncbi:hypothetical protein AB0A77_33775 [Streptomyces varsoviensis]|uniref:hypothetical protein n=1 Tax=Streptomyces varsoviensis TaxID=67373 RepID=UPI0033CEFE9E
MGLFNRKTAEALDATAGALHRAGRKVGGQKGGRAGDALATAALGPLHDLCHEDCTCKDCARR